MRGLEVKLEFGRLITAMITPFDDAGRVDIDTFAALADGLIEAGNDALLVTGTTGESPVLTEAERADLYREAVGVAKGRAKVIAGTGGYNTTESIALSQMAADCGVDGLLQVAPYYNKPPQEGLYQHFRAIAECTPLPNMIYNVPSRTVTNIAPTTVARCSQIENIFSVKEASGDLDQISEIIRTAEPGFLVYSGNDGDTLPMMALGAVGVVSVASHLVSGQIKAMMEAVVAGDLPAAAALHLEMLPLVRALFPAGWSSPIALKSALNSVGFRVGVPRLPLVEHDVALAAELASITRSQRLDQYLFARVG